MSFENKLKQAKLRLLKMHKEANVGHIGGNLSALDAILFLHLEVMQEPDSFILSKGHAAGALYVSLWSLGLMTDEQLRTFHQDNTQLAGHPVSGWMKQIKFSTGSLGHGLSLACGVAWARQLQKKAGRIFCLISDGELQEGSFWEALIFLAHHQLTQLTLLIDDNGLQGFGKTAEVSSIQSISQILRGFDVEISEIDGHNSELLRETLSLRKTKPHVIILKTIKGHGISFMQNQLAWHYLPLSNEQYEQALNELGST